MYNDNQTKNFKRIIIILVILLFGLGAYTLILFQESQANQLTGTKNGDYSGA